MNRRAEDPDVSSKPFDIGLAVARFCHVYPGAFDNGTIPWGLFWLLHNRMPNIAALGRVNQTMAVATGTGIGNGDDGAKRIAEQDRREAFPET